MQNEIKNILKVQGLTPKMSVPFIWGPPGGGKSDICNAIGEELGLKVVDVRLTQYDESVVTGYPITEEVNGKKFMGVALPWWVEEAMKQPSLIVFDELNRASLPTKNAALQILCERRIQNFDFPENVKMIACGNLGEEDGTDVEEMDSATLNRFAHFTWNPKTKEWVKWAESKNLNPCIVNYFRIRDESLFSREGSQNGDSPKAFRTPRTVASLAMLVDSIVGEKNRGDYKAVKEAVDLYGMNFIGSSYKGISRWLGQQATIGWRDVLDRYDEVRNAVLKLEDHRQAEIVKELTSHKFLEMTEEQASNYGKFLNDIRPDVSVGAALAIVDEIKKSNADITNNTNIQIIKQEAKKFFERLKKASDDTK